MSAIRVFFCCFGIVLGSFSALHAQNSITGGFPSYLEMCRKAAVDPYYFANFRSHSDYAGILECGQIGEFANYLLKNASSETLGRLNEFQALELIGNPAVHDVPGIGRFSGTTLRYIAIADQIQKLFTLPENSKVVEIGAGFGGQCYILSQLLPFSKYYIYDLPDVEDLIAKVLRTLAVKNACCLHVESELPEEKVDLLISNYAFSECDEQTQMDYFERVLKKADRGYLMFNQIGGFLTTERFVELLEKNNMNPRVYDELVFSYTNNRLVVWDKTQPSTAVLH